jgi:Tol biopolymer transport system component
VVPDGTRLVIPRLTDDGRIGSATVRADGSDYTPLPLDDATLNIGCGTGSWSPDGTRLTCEAWDDTDPARNGIYMISSVDGTILNRVTAAPDGDHDIPGSYSPNGKRLVFVRFDANGESLGLFVVNADGGGLRQITSAGTLLNIGADWSPQGNDIVFSRHITPERRGSLWLVHFNGADLREIHIQGLPCGGALADPESIGCHAPRWSPDGSELVFAANSQTAVNIYTARSDGTALTQVTHDGGADDPDWGTHPLAP